MDRWIFRITEPGASPRELSVSAGMTFGRREDNACVLKDESTSSRHFAIVDDGGVLAVEDLGSTNGTRLESGAVLKKGNRQRLQAGLKFRAGATSVEVKLAGAEDGGADDRTMRSAGPKGRPAKAAEKETPASAGDEADDERTIAGGPMGRGAAPAPAGAKKEAGKTEDKAAKSGKEAAAADDERTMLGGPDLRRKPAAPPPAAPPDSGDAADDERTMVGGGDALRRPPPSAPRAPSAASSAEEADDDERTIQGAGPLRISSLPSQEMLQGAGAVEESTPAEEAPAARAPEKKAPAQRAPTPPPEEPEPEPEPEPEAAAGEGATMAMPSGPGSGGAEATIAVAAEGGDSGERSIAELNPRFVIASPAMRKTVRIKSARFTFGREDTADCPINHGTVSNNHAQVTFDGRVFTLEDRGSKNGTFVGDVRLQQGEKRRIECGDHVRFAAVPAVFLTDGAGGPTPAEEAAAAALLVRKGKVSGEQRKQAAEAVKDLNRRLGEMLLLDTSLEVADWLEALESSRKGGGSVGGNNVMIAVITVLALIIIILIAVLVW